MNFNSHIGPFHSGTLTLSPKTLTAYFRVGVVSARQGHAAT